MSYNPTLIKIIEIDDFIIPLPALRPEGGEWAAIETHGTDGHTTYQFAECSEIQGDILGGEFLQVNSFDCTDECGGSCLREVLEPAFKESTGKLVAVVIWEGGDWVQTLTVEGGTVSWKPYEFGVSKQSPVKHSGVADREKAARFVEGQLGLERDYVAKDPKTHRPHYGVCELRDLLDFIYGGEPSADTEKIDAHKSTWHSGEHRE